MRSQCNFWNNDVVVTSLAFVATEVIHLCVLCLLCRQQDWASAQCCEACHFLGSEEAVFRACCSPSICLCYRAMWLVQQYGINQFGSQPSDIQSRFHPNHNWQPSHGWCGGKSRRQPHPFPYRHGIVWGKLNTGPPCLNTVFFLLLFCSDFCSAVTLL